MQPQYGAHPHGSYPQQQGYPPGTVPPPPQGGYQGYGYPPPQPGVAVGIPIQQGHPPQHLYQPQQVMYVQGPGGQLIPLQGGGQQQVLYQQQHQVVYQQQQHQVMYSHGASREDPQDYIAGFVFTLCCGLFGIICYACSNTQYYLNGFLSGMGLWLIAYGVLILAVGARSSNVGSITIGVLMFVVGVPLMAWGIYRKREQDRMFVPNVINVQPAMAGEPPGVVVIQQQPNGYQ